MSKISFKVVFSAMVLFLVSATVVSASTLTVDVNGNGDYQKIQDAINAANPGDMIIVNSGTYHESIFVHRQVTLQGRDNGSGLPVIEGDWIGDVVQLLTDGIVLDGFNITNSVPWWRSPSDQACVKIKSNNNVVKNVEVHGCYNGMRLENAGNNNIQYSTVASNYNGIYLTSSSNSNTLEGNNVNSNNNYGVYLGGSDSNKLYQNDVSGNFIGGYLDSSSNNEIKSSIFSSNTFQGIYLSSSNNNLIENVTAVSNSGEGALLLSSSGNELKSGTFNSNSLQGIHLRSSDSNTITDNIISFNTQPGIQVDTSHNNIISSNKAFQNLHGIYLSLSTYNIVKNNNLNNNQKGLSLSYADDNTIISNNITDNDWGLKLYQSNRNNITLNDFNNIMKQVWDSFSNNWNNNHYSDYDEPIEGCTDNNNDNICDSAYNIPGGSNMDRYPLVSMTPSSPGPCSSDETGDNIPWNDPSSEEGTGISTNEILEAIDMWAHDTPLCDGSTLSTDAILDLIQQWAAG